MIGSGEGANIYAAVSRVFGGILAGVIFFAVSFTPSAFAKLTAGGGGRAQVRLPCHVLLALEKAKPVAESSATPPRSLTLTIMLKRDDQAGFNRYLHEIYDSHLPR